MTKTGMDGRRAVSKKGGYKLLTSNFLSEKATRLRLKENCDQEEWIHVNDTNIFPSKKDTRLKLEEN